jgi:pSer/pThr/pTyr-binding forkhead associated (FHA) protein
MKLSLVVAQGVHSGKVIPVTSNEFVIGRDPQCQLRPASPAISKQHCALSVRETKAFIRDCGSTNGTFINGEQVAGELEVKTGDRLKVGPLEFDIRLEVGVLAPAAARPSGAKPSSKPGAKAVVSAAAVATDTVPEGATVLLEPPSANKGANTTVVDGGPSHPQEDPDHLAAMLLGLDEPAGSGATVESMSADPTTVMEMPALGSQPAEAKKEEKKTHGDSASAAAEVLSKYMRRPRT